MRLRIEVHGIVQGVGFRPFIYRLAREHGLTGHILNSESGVQIEVQGTHEDVRAFVEALPLEAPPLARIDEIRTSDRPLREEEEFRIEHSTRTQSANTLIAPDIATCPDCLRELLDPGDRRFGYPFLNCTNCGPRFTITRSVPYDRSQTSMAAFPMCPACQAEYDDPLNRRFHAQPNACWQCGPVATLLDNKGTPAAGDSIAETIRLLKDGRILAIKGLGGFHLAVDASQPEAIEELRWRKHRGEKPFAVMVASLDAARALCFVSEAEEELLSSLQRPIVLMRRRAATLLLKALAPDGDELGVFLPYTPIHHLLFATGELTNLVMTSANLSEEPIAIDNDEAIARLAGIADYFLVHNREILLRCDDSVVRHIPGEAGRTQFVRRSRGYVPSPIRLRELLPTEKSILAVGGELKNAICLSRGRYAFPGQHVGDLENLAAYDFFEESIAHFRTILEIEPEIIAHDLHPGYLSTQWAKRQPGVQLIGVQHHHAHIASCMAENQLTAPDQPPVIGIALDGTGYGTDGNAWGCEILVAGPGSFERAGHLAYVPMPGGEQAIHEPWRMAVAQLWATFGEQWRSHAPPSLIARVPAGQVRFVERLMRKDTRMARTSSCGRLFDAVAALVLGRVHVTYEAQAAIALEAVCNAEGERDATHGAYPFAIEEYTQADGRECLQIDPRPLFSALTDDLGRQVAPAILSRRFHSGLVEVLTEATVRIAGRRRIDQVCLSGGSFHNVILARGLEARLTKLGFRVYQQSQLPPGDGGLSLGQLLIAANSV